VLIGLCVARVGQVLPAWQNLVGNSGLTMDYEKLFELLNKANPGQDWTPEIGKDHSDLTVDDLHALRSLTAEYRVKTISFNGRTMPTNAL